MALEFKKIALSVVIGIACFYATSFLIGFISGIQTDTTQQPTEQATDRQGNPIFEEVLESKKLQFKEYKDQDGNKVWHVSKFIKKL
jgi:hypothetical protein